MHLVAERKSGTCLHALSTKSKIDLESKGKPVGGRSLQAHDSSLYSAVYTLGFSGVVSDKALPHNDDDNNINANDRLSQNRPGTFTAGLHDVFKPTGVVGGLFHHPWLDNRPKQ